MRHTEIYVELCLQCCNNCKLTIQAMSHQPMRSPKTCCISRFSVDGDCCTRTWPVLQNFLKLVRGASEARVQASQSTVLEANSTVLEAKNVEQRGTIASLSKKGYSIIKKDNARMEMDGERRGGWGELWKVSSSLSHSNIFVRS